MPDLSASISQEGRGFIPSVKHLRRCLSPLRDSPAECSPGFDLPFPCRSAPTPPSPPAPPSRKPALPSLLASIHSSRIALRSPHSRLAPPHVASLAPTLALASSRTFLQTALCSRPPASPGTRQSSPI